MNYAIRFLLFTFIYVTCFSQPSFANDGTIKIGFNLPFSGMFELVGNRSKNAALLVEEEIAAAGGLTVGDKKYDVEFVFGDNKSNPSAASALTVSQITKDSVLGIIGPLSSRQAIPVAQMANSFSTPMITSWSTSPKTTKDRPFVFRSCFVYTIQGPVLTKFAETEFNATKAAVLFDIVSAYPRGMAKAFRDAFDKTHGAGSVVSFEEFRTGDTDFSKQLIRIKKSGAQFIFTPQHFDEVPLIVKQAKELGLNIPIMGSNSWAGGDLIGECGSDCDGLYFTGNYAPGGAKGVNKEFVEAYQAAYNEYPDEPAALTWDAVRVFIQAVENTNGLTGNLIKDRAAVKSAIVNVKNFDGATGEMTFNESGDPSKCTVVVKIENGVFTFYDSVCL